MFKLEIETDNAAFEDAPFKEIARILRKLAKDLEQSNAGTIQQDIPLRDLNGNHVGIQVTTPRKESESIQDFIERLDIRAIARQVKTNPNMSDMPAGSTHWRVRIAIGRPLDPVHAPREMVVPFSMGPALKGPPDVATVLDCLASDSSGVDQGAGFEDWCADLGFDSDSRKAFRIYSTVQRQARELAEFLGQAEYGALLRKVERM